MLCRKSHALGEKIKIRSRLFILSRNRYSILSIASCEIRGGGRLDQSTYEGLLSSNIRVNYAKNESTSNNRAYSDGIVCKQSGNVLFRGSGSSAPTRTCRHTSIKLGSVFLIKAIFDDRVTSIRSSVVFAARFHHVDDGTRKRKRER